ncbi:uncharacterized protein At3g27210-like [Lolium rigidum]|uniref:uncharacterized protein At3g27210-like n=1 Tax=Lolium rigidum TaxID=89674 RepID=UPI001F5D8AFD|nr:uncharacterized protein At3g27210-like [Lolium rigidum]
MRFRIRKKPASAAAPAADGSNRTASSTAAVLAGIGTAGSGGGALIVASPDRYGTENGGSRDESFFEARPWLDSDSEDDFQSVRGDFTPARGSISTPDHQMQTFAPRLSVDTPKPSLTDKKQRLLELLQEKQQYDDEQDGATDAGSETGNGTVHAEEHLNPSGKVEKAKKPTKTGCFPCSVWKLSFKSCWKKKKEHKDL